MPPHPTPGLAHSTIGVGERLVLVHGFTQSSRSFGKIGTELARAYEVCAVDLPGHAGSVDVSATDLPETAELVGRTGGTATYLGYSLGGRICLALAHRRPDLVRRLILVGATDGIESDEERRARRAADEAIADRLDPPDSTEVALEPFLDEWLSQPLFADLTAEAQDRGSRRVNTPAGLACSLRSTGTGTQVPSRDRLGALMMPTLLVTGSNDVKFTAIARSMADRIGANATVAVLDGVGHAVPFEAPERFVSLVTEWLDRLA